MTILETVIENEGLLQNDEEEGKEDGENTNANETVITDEQLAKTWDAAFENGTWETFDGSMIVGKAVFRMVAFDLDEGDNGHLVYSLKAGRGLGKFQIDPNDGTVYATSNLKAGESYDMLVKAADRYFN